MSDKNDAKTVSPRKPANKGQSTIDPTVVMQQDEEDITRMVDPTVVLTDDGDDADDPDRDITRMVDDTVVLTDDGDEADDPDRDITRMVDDTVVLTDDGDDADDPDRDITAMVDPTMVLGEEDDPDITELPDEATQVMLDQATEVVPEGGDSNRTGTRGYTTGITSPTLVQGVDPGAAAASTGPRTGIIKSGPDAGKFIVRDRFVLEKRLGKGGMGEVFMARDLRKEEARDDDPYVAIKFLGEQFSRHPAALISLQREAKKSQQLAHPNVVTVYDFDRDGDRVYMTMEMLQGDALSGWEKVQYKEGKKPTEVDLVEEMAAGLAYAHSWGLVHSDFKPDNVFVTVDGRVKILDFGIARIMDDAVAKDSFDAGELGALTLKYASLEMLQGGHDPHPSDDIYALGLMAYQLFAGKHPYNGKNAAKALEEGIKPEPIKGLKRSQMRAINRAIALKRENRTASAEQFLKEFSGVSTRNRVLIGAIVALTISSGVFAYMASQREGPAVAFDDLPPQQQQQITENLTLGRQSADIQDWDGASRYFMAAYELHPRNADAEEGLDMVVESLVQAAARMESARQKGYLLKLIDGYSGNEYLANHEGLRELRAQLAADLAK